MTNRISTLVLSALVSCSGYVATAQSLPFDSTFGTNGIALLEKIPAYNVIDIALQSDGKILCLNGSNSYSYIERLNADGSLDNTFTGGDGFKFYSPFPTVINGVWQIGGKTCVIDGSLIRQTYDGKIMAVFAGVSIGRLNSNGEMDVTFGNISSVPGFLDLTKGSPAHMMNFIYDMYDARTAGLYFSSHTTLGSGGGQADTLLMAKVTTSGALVSSYGDNGILAAPLDTNKFGYYNTIIESIFTKDGKALVIGSGQRSAFPDNKNDMFIARFNLDGTLDNSFGTGGVFFKDFDKKNQYAYTVTEGNDGSIYVSGTSTNMMGAEIQYYTLKLSSTGVEDVTFGAGGAVINTPPSVAITASTSSTAITSYGKVYRSCVYGLGGIMDLRDEYFAFNADGSPNTQFAAGGVANPTGTISNSTYDKAFRLITQPDNKILILGADSEHPRIMRIKGDELPTAVQGIATTTATNKVWVAAGRAFVTTDGNDENKAATVTSIDGRVIRTYSNAEFKNNGNNVTTLQLPGDMPHGVYVLSVHQHSGAQQVKFVH
ncbi:MAG: hypothetical protein K9G49_16300 [Taibaiella sp.]|nr:hypothetical protein [Taibaiella sp.]